ncbi:hypothetical protein [Rhodococcus sp. NPDC127528]|uniref:hypothetical protein n=1 Tax=unclassified Rhodococcus (in: high G+C Gram-positive bacteria) TaxID=192944 RepID=UPI0036294318
MTRLSSTSTGLLIGLGVAIGGSVVLVQVAGAPSWDASESLLVFLWPVFAGFLAFAFWSWRTLPGRTTRLDEPPTEVPAGLLPPRREAGVDLDDLDDPSAFAMLHYNVCLSDLAADRDHLSARPATWW